MNYEGGAGDAEEPLVQYVPDTPYVSLSLPDGDALAQSMLMLSEGEWSAEASLLKIFSVS